MTAPLFSVVIPAFNVGSFIEETLASVLRQTCGDFELIVINDGSTDDTARKLGGIRDARLSVHHTPNRGVSHARNMGIALARGTYIAFLDGDDLWAPGHLEHAAAFFREQPDILWWSSSYYVASSPRPAEALEGASASRPARYYGAPSLVVCSSTAVLHAASARALLPLFPEDMRNAEDWAAWATFADTHPLIGFCRAEDTLYRRRPGSATSLRPSADTLLDTYMALPRHLARLNRRPAPEQALYFRYRTLQRWLLLFSRQRPTGWVEELRRQKQLLGLPLYLFIRTAACLLRFSRRALCKVLYELNRMQERRIVGTS